MNKRTIFFLLCFYFVSVNVIVAQNNERISYNGDCMKIDGHDVFVYSAAFHYFRTPKPLWRDRLAKIKAAGFNTVETYIPWNVNELNMPKSIDDQSHFDFTDVKDFLQMASEEFGLYVIARPGPFICAEWAGGGFPRWLAKYKPAKVSGEFWLRGDDPEYLKWCAHWYNAVNKVLVNYQITRKPKGSKGVIMEQIENEFDSHDTKNKEAILKDYYRLVRNAGIDVPIFTCLTSQCRGSKDEDLKNVFDADNFYVGLSEAPSCAKRIAALRQAQPNAPAFVTELQGGWFSLTKGHLSEEHESDYRHYQAISLMSMLGGATGLNTYMFVGGTHFAGWGARGQTTTYDYNAPIKENGSLTKKYVVAENIGKFIQCYGGQLMHSKGGLCTIQDAPKSLYGGVRVAADGTRFVFLQNTDPKTNISGVATFVPGRSASVNESSYNIDQNGNKVLIKTASLTSDTTLFQTFKVSYKLNGLGSQVLVIPPGKEAADGVWWFDDNINEFAKDSTSLHIRLSSVLKRNEDFNVKWTRSISSLPEMEVNDCRYVLYRSTATVSAFNTKQFTRLLFNSYSRDIINVLVNGKLAKRLAPSEQYAAEATRNINTSFKPITTNDFDNAFDITGLLKDGKNDIVALYENIGHEHGYVPMEQLCGINHAGLSDTLSEIKQQLDWQVSKNVSGVTNDWMGAKVKHEEWEVQPLDTATAIPRKGNNIQPKGKHTNLMTWYRAEFSVPQTDNAKAKLWRLLINASGNGYIYLNGHNIGRHWEIGPQREYYLPECWLNTGSNNKNVITLGLCQTMNGADIKAMEVASY
jgi:hypothetical protein